MREPESRTYDSYFVLEEKLYRFHKFKLEIFRKTSYVVVGLYTDTFKNIGIDGALCQVRDAIKFSGFFFKYLDKLCTDNLSLLLGIADSSQFIKEAVNGINIDEVCIHLIFENSDYLFRFTLSQEAMIDMDTYKLFADGFD
ncbi:hypothetical protein DSECCO2_659210 [anaerobic digester metagenome]